VLHDRPPNHFRSLEVHEIHELFMRLQQEIKDLANPFGTLRQNGESHQPTVRESHGKSQQKGKGKSKGKEKENLVVEETLLTNKIDGEVSYKDDRPALVISSTSWTPDEDFQILLDAVIKYDHHAEHAVKLGKVYPKILFVITGKGPLREYYENKIKQLHLNHTRIMTLWLKAEDYPLLLGSCDLGICLHKSSSGLDLPMKVVDMFGCGVPVCAVGFKCLGELVKHEENGLIFEDADGLANAMMTLCEGSGVLVGHVCEIEKNPLFKQLKKGVAEFQALRWEENWNKNALPIFQASSAATSSKKRKKN